MTQTNLLYFAYTRLTAEGGVELLTFKTNAMLAIFTLLHAGLRINDGSLRFSLK